MSGSNRGIVAALGGVALLLAFGLGAYVTTLRYPEPDRYQRYSYPGDDEEAARATAKASDPAQYRAPCDNPKGHDESDLCAQWRAAKAAESSALWTMAGFWTALFGIIGLYWQIYLTRKAVEDTSEATESMRKANEQAREEGRAWLAISVTAERILQNRNALGFYYRVAITNLGKTAAKNVLWLSTVYDINREGFVEKTTAAWEGGRVPYDRVLMPGQKLEAYRWHIMVKTELEIAESARGELIYPGVLGYVMYTLADDPTPRYAWEVFQFTRINPQPLAELLSGRDDDPVLQYIELDHLPLDRDQLSILSFGSVAT